MVGFAVVRSKSNAKKIQDKINEAQILLATGNSRESSDQIAQAALLKLSGSIVDMQTAAVKFGMRVEDRRNNCRFAKFLIGLDTKIYKTNKRLEDFIKINDIISELNYDDKSDEINKIVSDFKIISERMKNAHSVVMACMSVFVGFVTILGTMMGISSCKEKKSVDIKVNQEETNPQRPSVRPGGRRRAYLVSTHQEVLNPDVQNVPE